MLSENANLRKVAGSTTLLLITGLFSPETIQMLNVLMGVQGAGGQGQAKFNESIQR